MSKMIQGQWESEYRPTDGDGNGAFLRKPSVFRDQLPVERPAAGRYHLFVAWTCPWAHRTLLVRAIKGLEALIPSRIIFCTKFPPRTAVAASLLNHLSQ